MEMKLEGNKKKERKARTQKDELSLQSWGITVISAVDKAWLSQQSLSCWHSLISYGKNQPTHWHLLGISHISADVSVLPEHPL